MQVYTRSAVPGHKGYKWESDGYVRRARIAGPSFPMCCLDDRVYVCMHSTGSYTLCEAEGVQRGTKIIIDLRDDALQFAKVGKVSDCIQTMSNFVGFPITLNGDRVNTVQVRVRISMSS